MSRIDEMRDFVQAVDPELQRSFPFEVEEVRDSGAGGGVYTVKGHAAVFNKWSLDLGGFRERIKKGAFDNALSKDPHVLHLWDHDTTRALSSTRSTMYPLELRVDPNGLHFYSKVAPTSYSEDMRVLLEGGVISQSSFAFTVAKDEWRLMEEEGEERVERTIVEVDQLFDVTTCAMGAYPTTDSALAVRNLSLGRSAAIPTVASLVGVGGETENAPAPDPVVTPQTSSEDVVRELNRLKRHADSVVQTAHERALRRKEATS
jgi:HK97 family phage prohead protease